MRELPDLYRYTISKWAMQAMQEVWLTEHLGGKSNIIYSSILPGTVNSSLPQKAVYGKICLLHKLCFVCLEYH